MSKVIQGATKPETPTLPAFDAGAVVTAFGRFTSAVSKPVRAFLDACLAAGVPRDEAGCKAIVDKVESDIYEAAKAALAKSGVDLSTLDRAQIWAEAGRRKIIARSTAKALAQGAARMHYWSGQASANGAPIELEYSSSIAVDPSLILPWSKGFKPEVSLLNTAGRVQVPAEKVVQTAAKATSRKDLDAAIRKAVGLARALTLHGLAADLLDAARSTLTDFTE